MVVNRNRGLPLPDPDSAAPVMGTLRRQVPTKNGEHRLLLAVLEDAIHCYQKHLLARSRNDRQLFEDAERWIMGWDGSRLHRVPDDIPTFSFENICEVLGLDAQYLRRGLRSWRAAQLAGTANSSAPDLT